MNQKHETCLAKFLSHRPSFRWEKFRWESFLQVNLAATPRVAGDSLCCDRRQNTVPGPPLAKFFRTNEDIILIVRMDYMIGWRGDTKRGMLLKFLRQD